MESDSGFTGFRGVWTVVCGERLTRRITHSEVCLHIIITITSESGLINILCRILVNEILGHVIIIRTRLIIVMTILGGIHWTLSTSFIDTEAAHQYSGPAETNLS